MPCFLRPSSVRYLRLRLGFYLPPSILTVAHLCLCAYNARVTNENHDTLGKIFRLIEEQTKSLQSRLSPEVAIRCQERSDRIRELLDQIRQSGSQQTACDVSTSPKRTSRTGPNPFG